MPRTKITKDQLAALFGYLDFTDDDWLLLHTHIEFDDVEHRVTISIDDVDEVDYEMLREFGREG